MFKKRNKFLFLFLKEKSALRYTEKLTKLGYDGISDDIYNDLKKYFNDKDITILTYIIIISNDWNRLNIAFANHSCDYKPGQW